MININNIKIESKILGLVKIRLIAGLNPFSQHSQVSFDPTQNNFHSHPQSNNLSFNPSSILSHRFRKPQGVHTLISIRHLN